jgi:glycosyltransferase involved in cell wall biosynthesis
VQGVRIVGYKAKKVRLAKVQSALTMLSLIILGKVALGANPYADLIDTGAKLKADVYHCHEIWSLYAGIQIKKMLEKEGKKPKLIYDVHEFTPSMGSDARVRIARRIFSNAIVHFEKRALQYVDYVITVNQIIRGYLLYLNNFIQTEVLYNCPVLSIFQEPKTKEINRDRVIICHEGSLGFERGLKQMIDVMRALKERYGDRVELLIIGDVYSKEKEYLEVKLNEYKFHDTIKCTGWLPYEKVGEAISQADVGIIFMEPTINNMLAGPPNKIFNYMRYGLPVVSVDLPETSRIISETQCGLVVRDRSTSSLAEALSTLIDDERKRRQMAENARNAVYNQYNWEQMEKSLLRVYDKLFHIRS